MRGRDGTKIRTAVFGGRNSPLCVLLHGQTEFIEKYDEVIGELIVRGFCVATMDWRCQGGSGRALADGRKIHVDDFARYDEDLAQFFAEVAAPLGPAKLALAHSMGAHILLRALYRDSGLVGRAVLSAPMLKIDLQGHPELFARGVAGAMRASGRGGNFVWGTEERDPRRLSFNENFVTRDKARFERWQEALRGDEALCVNGPTWSWLAAAFRSMRKVGAAGFAEKIATPMLLLGAGADRVVDTKAVKDFADRAPNARYVEIAGAEHEILMERDAIRAQFWKAFDAFIAE